MTKIIETDLKLQNGYKVHVNDSYLDTYKDDILSFLDGLDEFKTLDFAKNIMMGQEIKANNTIEGIVDDLSIIDEVIKTKEDLSSEERKRIINLYHGYEYILKHRSIDRESIADLYALLSNGLLDEYNLKNTSRYHREAPVYIQRNSRIEGCPYTDNMSRYFYDPMFDFNRNAFHGIKVDEIDEYMKLLIDYVNNDKDKNSIDSFIKSQIIHFYFVYIHPYMDVNGRTSRTIAMWYLLNKEEFPYIIFNEAIAFNKGYEDNIMKSRDRGDLTLFLKYMMISVQKELEKHYLINNISSNYGEYMNKELKQLTQYIISMKGTITIKDITTFYNSYNSKKSPIKLYEEMIKPLLDENVLVKGKDTKKYIDGDIKNSFIYLNDDLIDVDEKKFKYLKLERFHNK